MANKYSTQILTDGFRNAVVKITGVLDTSDAVLKPAVRLTDFLTNDTANLRFVGFKLMHIWHAIGDGLEAQVAWNGVNDQLILAIDGRGRETFAGDGGLVPNQGNTGYDGSINVYTTGYGTGANAGMTIQNFSILLEMVKLYKS